jgi:hypothetical protein
VVISGVLTLQLLAISITAVTLMVLLAVLWWNRNDAHRAAVLATMPGMAGTVCVTDSVVPGELAIRASMPARAPPTLPIPLGHFNWLGTNCAPSSTLILAD